MERLHYLFISVYLFLGIYFYLLIFIHLFIFLLEKYIYARQKGMFIYLFIYLLEKYLYTRKKDFFCLLGFLTSLSPAETLIGFSSRKTFFILLQSNHH